jgi:hypothetical protein
VAGAGLTQTVQGKPFWLCELQGGDVEVVGATFVEVPTLDATFYANHTIESGSTTLIADGAVIEVNATSAELLIPEGTEPILGMTTDSRDDELSSLEGGRKRGRRKLVEGTRSVLVVRVTSTVDGSAPSLSRAALATSVFTDAVNLKSQFTACSYGKLNFVPATGTSITGGATTVSVNVAIKGAIQDNIRNAAEAVLVARYGDLPSKFDHVIYCIPKGTIDADGGDW